MQKKLFVVLSVLVLVEHVACAPAVPPLPLRLRHLPLQPQPAAAAPASPGFAAEAPAAETSNHHHRKLA